jgi:hypothetical protein
MRPPIGPLVILLAGIALWILTPQLTAVYPPHQFWVTNPANHARRNPLLWPG